MSDKRTSKFGQNFVLIKCFHFIITLMNKRKYLQFCLSLVVVVVYVCSYPLKIGFMIGDDWLYQNSFSYFPIKPTQCVKVMLCNVVDVGNLCFDYLVKKCGTYLFFCLRCCAVYGFPERRCSYICRSTLAFVTIPPPTPLLPSYHRQLDMITIIAITSITCLTCRQWKQKLDAPPSLSGPQSHCFQPCDDGSDYCDQDDVRDDDHDDGDDETLIIVYSQCWCPMLQQ